MNKHNFQEFFGILAASGFWNLDYWSKQGQYSSLMEVFDKNDCYNDQHNTILANTLIKLKWHDPINTPARKSDIFTFLAGGVANKLLLDYMIPRFGDQVVAVSDDDGDFHVSEWELAQFKSRQCSVRFNRMMSWLFAESAERIQLINFLEGNLSSLLDKVESTTTTSAAVNSSSNSSTTHNESENTTDGFTASHQENDTPQSYLSSSAKSDYASRVDMDQRSGSGTRQHASTDSATGQNATAESGTSTTATDFAPLIDRIREIKDKLFDEYTEWALEFEREFVIMDL